MRRGACPAELDPAVEGFARRGGARCSRRMSTCWRSGSSRRPDDAADVLQRLAGPAARCARRTDPQGLEADIESGSRSSAPTADAEPGGDRSTAPGARTPPGIWTVLEAAHLITDSKRFTANKHVEGLL